MFEILVYLYESYRSARLAPDRASLERRLFAAGFEEKDIGYALDWFARMADAPTHPRLAELVAGRHWAPEERRQLSPECLEELESLDRGGVLDPESREWVVNGLMSLGGEDIDAEQVRWMSLIVLWSRGHIEHFTLLEDLLLDDRHRYLH